MLLATKLKIPLDDGWDLWVINRGRHEPVILSFAEHGESPVKERIAAHLSHSKAIQLARALAGVTNQSGPTKPHRDFSDFDDSEEDTIP